MPSSPNKGHSKGKKLKRKSKDKAVTSRQPLDWYEGFRLTELARSSGDFKYIEKKMTDTMVDHSNGIDFSGYDILSVHKVLNSDGYNRYREHRREMNFRIAQGRDPDAAYVEEMRLWHGSPHAETICKKGFDLQPANPNGMFGKGVYFAEHSSKSNQYSWGVGGGCPPHRNQSCYSCTRQMLLCKVAIGRKYLAPNLVKNAPQGIDTVIANPNVINVNLRYPEYIIYHQDQAYPGYLIKYKILPPKCDECKKTDTAIKTQNPAALPVTIAIPQAANQCTIC